MSRVLLLTSHPVSAPRDSADKELAWSIARSLPTHAFVGFRRLGSPPLDRVPGQWIPVWSRGGRPGIAERAQITALGVAAEPAVDLVHAVLSIGPSYGRLTQLRNRLPGWLKRPVVHTVPGVLDRRDLGNAGPLGLTVALSDSTADMLRAHGFPDVRLIPPGIPLEQWPMLPRPVDVPPMVLFAGHYDPGGGAEQAIAAVGDAVRRRPDRPVRLVLAMRTRIGQDEAVESERLRTIALAQGVGSLDVRGVVPDMKGLIAAASVVLLLARDLAGKADVPLTVLQAMATGRPVVLSDLPPFRALGPGIPRLPVDDAAAAGEVIRDLIDNDRRWAEAAAVGRREVVRAYSDSAMALAYDALYRELMFRA